MDNSQSNALHKAVGEDDVEEVRRLLESGVPIAIDPSYGNSLILTACQMRSFRALATLLEHGADPNERITYRSPVDGRVEEGYTALMYASDPATIELLVKFGADVNAVSTNGLSALMRFAHFGDVAAVSALLASGADTTLKQLKGKGGADRSAIEFAQDSLKFWETFPKGGLTPEGIARIEEYRKTFALLSAASVLS